MIRLTLDYPPSANRYWRVARNKVYRSNEAESYCKYVNLLCTTAGILLLDGDLSITLHLYRPQRSGDLDNRIKIVLDSLQGVAYGNDSQIAEIHAHRFEDKRNPRVEITIERLGA